MANDTEEEFSEQLFVAIQFGGEDEEPVMMPVDDLAVMEDEGKKEQLIDSAWAFYQRGKFARETTNPEFIRALAGDFSKSLPLPNMLARGLAARLGTDYVDRLEKEAHEKGEAIVDANASHLKLEGQGTDSVTIVLDFPEGWQEKAIERLTGVTSGIFSDASDGIGSWYGFTEWIWLNQLTRALEDLEMELGEDALASMSQPEFWKTLLGRMLEHQDSSAQFAELMLRWLEMVADVVIEGISTGARTSGPWNCFWDFAIFPLKGLSSMTSNLRTGSSSSISAGSWLL